MIMVILGGVGRFWGGPVGAVVLLALEALLGQPFLGPYSLHWQLPVGAILLAVVLFAPQGIAGAEETSVSASAAWWRSTASPSTSPPAKCTR